MKTLLLAGVMSLAFATASYADMYWVAGHRTGQCEIVTSNPVVYSLPAYAGLGGKYDIYFSSGPYASLDDAKLARSGISACPPAQPESADADKK